MKSIKGGIRYVMLFNICPLDEFREWNYVNMKTHIFAFTINNSSEFIISSIANTFRNMITVWYGTPGTVKPSENNGSGNPFHWG